MAKKFVWTLKPIERTTIVDVNNDILDITLNGTTHNLAIEQVGYMTSVIRHESRLVDKLNELLSDLSLNVEVKLGVIAEGNTKSTFVIFVHEDTDTFSYDGIFKNVIGEINTFPVV